jgi:hypothetical protein
MNSEQQKEKRANGGKEREDHTEKGEGWGNAQQQKENKTNKEQFQNTAKQAAKMRDVS